MNICYLVANIGFDTAENGPLKVCQKLANSSKSIQNKHRPAKRGAESGPAPGDGASVALRNAGGRAAAPGAGAGRGGEREKARLTGAARAKRPHNRLRRLSAEL